MGKLKKIGFVSVELVIMAAIILTSGLAGVFVFGEKGSNAMQDGLDKLTSLGIFGGGGGISSPTQFSST